MHWQWTKLKVGRSLRLATLYEEPPLWGDRLQSESLHWLYNKAWLSSRLLAVWIRLLITLAVSSGANGSRCHHNFFYVLMCLLKPIFQISVRTLDSHIFVFFDVSCVQSCIYVHFDKCTKLNDMNFLYLCPLISVALADKVNSSPPSCETTLYQYFQRLSITLSTYLQYHKEDIDRIWIYLCPPLH